MCYHQLLNSDCECIWYNLFFFSSAHVSTDLLNSNINLFWKLISGAAICSLAQAFPEKNFSAQ